jgi:hypothetical protein
LLWRFFGNIFRVPLFRVSGVYYDYSLTFRGQTHFRPSSVRQLSFTRNMQPITQYLPKTHLNRKLTSDIFHFLTKNVLTNNPSFVLHKIIRLLFFLFTLNSESVKRINEEPPIYASIMSNKATASKNSYIYIAINLRGRVRFR